MDDLLRLQRDILLSVTDLLIARSSLSSSLSSRPSRPYVMPFLPTSTPSSCLVTLPSSAFSSSLSSSLSLPAYSVVAQEDTACNTIPYSATIQDDDKISAPPSPSLLVSSSSLSSSSSSPSSSSFCVTGSRRGDGGARHVVSELRTIYSRRMKRLSRGGGGRAGVVNVGERKLAKGRVQWAKERVRGKINKRYTTMT
eukprot:TRINITY_DN641_c3_g1_i1.p1 TRINITY_DN641_c3_g1~~TRINITY_DN641_c3_g1_i1.p1  ORF type:complete len:197 (+),score=57.89 TRINITY_DN641_c3_g1_i1:112-702(+)